MTTCHSSCVVPRMVACSCGQILHKCELNLIDYSTTFLFLQQMQITFLPLFSTNFLPKKRQLVCTSTHKKNTAHNKLQQHSIARGNKTNFCRESKQTVRRKTTAGSCVKRNVSFCPFFCENSEKTVDITATLNFF